MSDFLSPLGYKSIKVKADMVASFEKKMQPIIVNFIVMLTSTMISSWSMVLALGLMRLCGY